MLGIATQAGLGDRKRWIHAGYLSALALGLVTWFASSRLIAVSGAKREMIEGVTALLATLVLFYVSFAPREERGRALDEIPPRPGLAEPRRRVALLRGLPRRLPRGLLKRCSSIKRSSLNASTAAALVGALGGAVVLAVIVLAYSRAGRFAPPQIFFKISSYLLYALAVVFIGQGIAALQLTGTAPIHPLPIPSIPPSACTPRSRPAQRSSS